MRSCRESSTRPGPSSCCCRKTIRDTWTSPRLVPTRMLAMPAYSAVKLLESTVNSPTASSEGWLAVGSPKTPPLERWPSSEKLAP